MTKMQPCNSVVVPYLFRGLALVFFIGASSAQALRFEPTDELTIDLDTTLAYGAMWRVEKQKDLGPPVPIRTDANNATNQSDPEFQRFVTAWNSDDGNRNFDKGDLVSNRYAITSDFDMRMGNYGLFLRGQMFYDSVYFEETSWDGEGWEDWRGGATLNCYGADGGPGLNPPSDWLVGPFDSTSNTADCNDIANSNYGAFAAGALGSYLGPESINNVYAAGDISNTKHFSQDVKDRHGFDARFLDAYIYGTFPIGDRNLDLRLGRQVLGWGEALMLQGGIGFGVNRIDASAATSPGVELKEIFLPTGMLYGQLDLSDTLTVEAYWQYEWKPSELFATGAYFSAQDFLESDVLLVNTEFNKACMFGLGKFSGDGTNANGEVADPTKTIKVCDGPNVNFNGTQHWAESNPNAMYKADDVEPDHQSDQYGLAFRFLPMVALRRACTLFSITTSIPLFGQATTGRSIVGYLRRVQTLVWI
jgi:hypothetical protein